MLPTETRPAVLKADSLALLYQNILTSVVRIQSGRQPLTEMEVFRKRIKAALTEVEREAGVAGYRSAEIKEAEFAVVAFLDETILSSREPGADDWRKRPLNTELFDQAVAGDVFFERLLEIERRPDSARLADVMEVYLLCLLLGLEGRFAPPLRGEAYRIMDRIRHRVETIRGSDYSLSPPMDFAKGPVTVAKNVGAWRWWAGGIIAATILLFFLYYVSLAWRTEGLESIRYSPHSIRTAGVQS